MLQVRRGCEVAVRDICAKDPDRLGNRGSHRYSFAGAHKQSVVEFSVRTYLREKRPLFPSPLFKKEGAFCQDRLETNTTLQRF